MSVVKTEGVTTKTIPELADCYNAQAQRGGQGENQANALMRWVPLPVVRLLVSVMFYLNEVWGFPYRRP